MITHYLFNKTGEHAWLEINVLYEYLFHEQRPGYLLVMVKCCLGFQRLGQAGGYIVVIAYTIDMFEMPVSVASGSNCLFRHILESELCRNFSVCGYSTLITEDKSKSKCLIILCVNLPVQSSVLLNLGLMTCKIWKENVRLP